jgi:hypothetical protein
MAARPELEGRVDDQPLGSADAQAGTQECDIQRPVSGHKAFGKLTLILLR